MKIHGWGRYPIVDADVVQADSVRACSDVLARPGVLVARGRGKSYGDSANAATVLQTDYLDHYVEFNADSGLITCQAGLTIRDLLALIVPRGWFIPVTPGTSQVTIGGAIASDVHGKNHHLSGTFSQHVRQMQVMLASGEILTVSPTSHVPLFRATCGGMGLAGVILSAQIQLLRIGSSNIVQTTIKADSLQQVCEQFDANAASRYSVAWIDCLTRGRHMGRSLLMVGDHATDGVLEVGPVRALNIPFNMPAALLNPYSIKAFNTLYYHKAVREVSTATLPYTPYFYPLDAMSNWNRLYGKSGFVQYQFVVPRAAGVDGLRTILAAIADSGKGSFLAVLKTFGRANDNYLSFPIEGYTLALDFMLTPDIPALFARIDQMVADLGGRIYLAKDALMSEQIFKRTYPQWEQFEQVREQYGATGKFASQQSKRLGLK